MSFNPFDPELFAVRAPCLPCCVAPSACACALLIPPIGGSPFADYATAVAAIAADVASCIIYYEPAPANATLNSLTASFDGTTLAANVSTNLVVASSNEFSLWFSVSVKAGSTLALAFTTTGIGPIDCEIDTYACADGSFLDSVAFGPGVEGSGTAYVSVPFVTDGEYLMNILVFGSGLSTTLTGAFSITDDMVFTVNPVIALWDDSGTTRQLEACPKMLLPPFTEVSGDWYASCADAHTVLSDSTKVASCIAYADNLGGGPISSFAASGGSSPSLAISMSGPVSVIPNIYFSVNCVAGDTLTANYTNNSSNPGGGITISDYAGNLLFGLPITGTSGSPSSAVLPYTGRYIIGMGVSDIVMFPASPTLTDASLTLSSSGTMSTNPIQARYDLGLTCAGLLNCGDTCP